MKDKTTHLSVIILSLALGEVAPGDAVRALRKELSIGAGNSVVLALAIGFIAFGWKGSVLLGAVDADVRYRFEVGGGRLEQGDAELRASFMRRRQPDQVGRVTGVGRICGRAQVRASLRI